MISLYSVGMERTILGECKKAKHSAITIGKQQIMKIMGQQKQQILKMSLLVLVMGLLVLVMGLLMKRVMRELRVRGKTRVLLVLVMGL